MMSFLKASLFSLPSTPAAFSMEDPDPAPRELRDHGTGCSGRSGKFVA